MPKIVTHRFQSPKTDGADPTQIQPSNWNDGHLLIGGVAGDVLTRDPTDATFGGKWVTPTPGAPLPGGGVTGDLLTRDTTIATYGAKWQPAGVWVDVPYSAANFTAYAPTSWIVESSDQKAFGYLRIGNLMIVDVYLGATSVAGAPGAPLQLLLPIAPAHDAECVIWGNDNGIVVATRVRMFAANRTVFFYRMDGQDWQVTTNGTYISGQLVIRI